MLKIRGTKREINLAGEIFNTVLEMLGGDSLLDGFGYTLPSEYELKVLHVKMPKILTLKTMNSFTVNEQLELIIWAMHASSDNGGLFSKKENWLEDFRSRN